jgi:hypothetical protein
MEKEDEGNGPFNYLIVIILRKLSRLVYYYIYIYIYNRKGDFSIFNSKVDFLL